MILNVTHVTNANASATFSNCIIQNNNASYTYLTKANTANGIAGSMSGGGNSSTDSYINCLFANNKMTNLYACYFPVSQGSVSTVIHKMYNCVFWNNQNTITATAKTVTMYSNGTQNASAAFDNNYLDADKSGTWTGWGANNKIDLSKTNTTATTGPQFIRPPLNAATNIIGASASFTSGTDLTAISQSDWRMLSTSYLYHKGMNTTTTTISIDKAGLSFYASSPTVGPYEYAQIPIISWTQDFSLLKTGDAAVTLTAASTITPASSPAGTAITYTSGNNNVVSVSGSTLSIVGVGTTTVTAHQAANVDYPAAADVSKTVTVRLPQTITYTGLSNKVYGSAPFTLTASASSGLPVTFSSNKPSVATVSGNTATIVAVGSSCYFTITQAGDATYAPVSTGQMGFSVTKKPLTITAPSIASKVYDGSTTSGTVTPGTLSDFVGTETVTVSAATGAYSDANVGTGKMATITYTLANGTNGGLATNYSLANGSATGDITAATLTLNNAETTFIASDYTLPQLANSDLVVSAGKFIADRTTNALYSVTVAPGAKLTLNSGSSLDATSLTLQSDATNGTGTYVDLNAAGNTGTIGTATVNQNLSSYRTWYMSSPVADAKPTVNIDRIKYYTDAYNNSDKVNSWPTLYNSSSVPYGSTAKFEIGKGYLVVPLSGNNIAFSGTLNSGVVPITLQKTVGTDKSGFNLIGNPYPSYLDWTLVYRDAANANKLVDGTMWYRTKVGTYTFWTVIVTTNTVVSSPAEASNSIPPMQAFWVRTAANANVLTLNKDMRVHAPAENKLLKAPATVNAAMPLVRLQVSNGANTDEAVIYFSADASNGRDAYDAPKMSNENAAIPEIYTTLGTEQIVINGMNAIPMNQEIGLGFVAGDATSFSLKANEVSNLPAGVKLILKDNVTNAETDITDGVVAYTFAPLVTSGNRFSVIFRSAGSITGLDKNADNKLLVYSINNKQITVVTNDASPLGSTLSVYNAIGQKLLNKRITANVTTIDGNFTAGVYMVTVNNVTKKVIVK